MTAGYTHEEVFSELKLKLLNIRKKYIDYDNSIKDRISSFKEECNTNTDKYIKEYAAVLEKTNQLTEDFKSTYVRWLYDNRRYQELLDLNDSFRGIDYGLYTSLVKFKTKQLNSKKLIDELKYYKKKHLETEFPYTLFYAKTTLDEIDKRLVIAYYKNFNIIKLLPAIAAFIKRNRSAIFNKVTSNVYRILPL
jgi:hypothetical protein